MKRVSRFAVAQPAAGLLLLIGVIVHHGMGRMKLKDAVVFVAAAADDRGTAGQSEHDYRHVRHCQGFCWRAH